MILKDNERTHPGKLISILILIQESALLEREGQYYGMTCDDHHGVVAASLKK